jgi:hypothetical protein
MKKNPRRPAHAILAGGLVALASLCAPATARAQSYWFERYERAVDLIDEGLVDQAAPLLEEVVKVHPVPVSGLRVPGDRTIDYQPWFQRARLFVRCGDLERAERNLDLSEALGATENNPRMKKEHLKLRQLIMALESEAGGAAGSAGRR